MQDRSSSPRRYRGTIAAPTEEAWRDYRRALAETGEQPGQFVDRAVVERVHRVLRRARRAA